MASDPSSTSLDRTLRDFVPDQKVFGRYTLTRILGRGGMGVVWLAHDDELDRDVALKFLPEIIIHDRAIVGDLKRETKRALELTHKNIIRIHDFVQDSISAGISMEYVDGDTLSNLRSDKATRIFEPNELKPWLTQLCDALDYAHNQARIIHRDLKPSNLMISKRGQMKIADFGIARSLTESVSVLTHSPGTSGTLVYMSPQQLDGLRATHLDDIYSVGATTYELLTSKPPFYSGDIGRQIHERTPPSMMQRRADLDIEGNPIPKNWEETIASCLAKEPARRPQTVTEVARRLGLHHTTELAAVATRPWASKPTATRTAIAIAITIAIIAAAGLLLFQRHQQRQAATQKQITLSDQLSVNIEPLSPASTSPSPTVLDSKEALRRDLDAAEENLERLNRAVTTGNVPAIENEKAKREVDRLRNEVEKTDYPANRSSLTGGMTPSASAGTPSAESSLPSPAPKIAKTQKVFAGTWEGNLDRVADGATRVAHRTLTIDETATLTAPGPRTSGTIEDGKLLFKNAGAQFQLLAVQPDSTTANYEEGVDTPSGRMVIFRGVLNRTGGNSGPSPHSSPTAKPNFPIADASVRSSEEIARCEKYRATSAWDGNTGAAVGSSTIWILVQSSDELLATLHDDGGSIGKAVFSNDGHYIAYDIGGGSIGHTMRLYKISEEGTADEIKLGMDEAAASWELLKKKMRLPPDAGPGHLYESPVSVLSEPLTLNFDLYVDYYSYDGAPQFGIKIGQRTRFKYRVDTNSLELAGPLPQIKSPSTVASPSPTTKKLFSGTWKGRCQSTIKSAGNVVAKGPYPANSDMEIRINEDETRWTFYYVSGTLNNGGTVKHNGNSVTLADAPGEQTLTLRNDRISASYHMVYKQSYNGTSTLLEVTGVLRKVR